MTGFHSCEYFIEQSLIILHLVVHFDAEGNAGTPNLGVQRIKSLREMIVSRRNTITRGLGLP